MTHYQQLVQGGGGQVEGVFQVGFRNLYLTNFNRSQVKKLFYNDLISK